MRGSAVEKRGSAVEKRGSAVEKRGSAVKKCGSAVESAVRGMRYTAPPHGTPRYDNNVYTPESVCACISGCVYWAVSYTHLTLPTILLV